jgi:ParB family chromosome partitioning protein
LEAVTQILRRAQIDGLEQAIKTLKAGLQDLGEEAMKNRREGSNSSRKELRELSIFTLYYANAENVVGKSEKEIIQETFEGLMSLESFMTHRLRLLNLPPEILEALKQGQIAYTKAKAIAKLDDADARKKLLDEAIQSSLSLTQIQERVADIIPRKEKYDLRNRFDATYKQVRKTKSLWQDPKKKRKLKSLLRQLEKLMEEGG